MDLILYYYSINTIVKYQQLDSVFDFTSILIDACYMLLKRQKLSF